MKKYLKLILTITLIFAFSANILRFTVYAEEADKALLSDQLSLVQDAIDIQNNSAEPYYLDASYAAFLAIIDDLGGITGIESVIADPNATQQDVDDLAASLTSALDGLILDDTYYSVLSEYSTAKAKSLVGFTNASIILYNDELDRINVILNNPTAGETAIESLSFDIENASDLLVVLGDKTEMNDLINQINTIYSGDGSNYIPSTFQSFKDSFDDIDNILNNEIGMSLQAAIDDNDLGQPDVDIIVVELNNVLNNLVVKPDKTDLITDYNTAMAMDLSQYTSSSAANFTTGLINIKQVIDDVEATASDVTQAETDLTNLYNILVDKADVTNLLAAYNDAITMDTSSYTPNSVVIFDDALSDIYQVIISDDTDQLEADQALSDLNSAYDLLIEKADKSALDTKNNEAIVAYYEEKDNYTSDSYQLFKNAVNDYGNYLYINTILQDENISQSEVDSLVNTIQSALDLLVAKADNTNLLKVYDILKETDLDGYTTDSKNAFNQEMQRIYNEITSDNLDKIKATKALTDLNNVTNLLVSLPDFSELQDLVDSAKVYREEDYSISSYKALQFAIDDANQVINDDNASENEVDIAITNLSEAIDNLMPFESTLYIKQGDSIDINQYVTLGNATVVSYDSSNSNIITINGKGIITANRYGQSLISITLSNGVVEELNYKVIASVSNSTLILTISLPIVGIGVGVTVIFTNKITWIKLLNRIKNIFKK